MSDRLTAICLALLLAAPLCYVLDGDIFGVEAEAAAAPALPSLSLEEMTRHAEGLQVRMTGPAKDHSSAD